MRIDIFDTLLTIISYRVILTIYELFHAKLAVLEEIYMPNFKGKFILQFIIDVLVLGILFTILFRVIGAVLCSNLEGTDVCLPIVLCSLLGNVFAAGIAVFITQNTLSKKGITDAPQPYPFYLIVAAVLIAMNICFTVMGFSVLEGWCRNNISVTVPADTIRPAVSIRPAVRNAVIVSDIVQTVLHLAFVPLWKKHHERLF